MLFCQLHSSLATLRVLSYRAHCWYTLDQQPYFPRFYIGYNHCLGTSCGDFQPAVWTLSKSLPLQKWSPENCRENFKLDHYFHCVFLQIMIQNLNKSILDVCSCSHVCVWICFCWAGIPGHVLRSADILDCQPFFPDLVVRKILLLTTIKQG